MAYIKPTKTFTKAATGNLSVLECTDSMIINYGQTEANTLTLPAAVANMSFIAAISTAGMGAFNIKAAANDKFYLNGTALDDADKISCATPAVGNCIVIYSFQVASGAYDLIALTGNGTWTDGGA